MIKHKICFIFIFIVTTFRALSVFVYICCLCISYSSSVELLSCVGHCDPMYCSTPGFPIHHQLLELAQTHVHRVSDAIQSFVLCRPHLLLPSVFPSIRLFSSESVLHIRWPKYWSFILSFSPSSEYSGLISFRIDWFDLHVDSQESSPTPPVQKDQFLSAQLSLWSHSHIHTWLLEKP